MTDDTFESRLSWEKQVEFCLYKLSENGAYPISLGCVSRYQSPAEVPLEQREVVLLRIREEMKFQEIAGLQGCSLSTVKSRYRLGIERLRKEMRDDEKKR